jgi:GAF domain-containing protein
MITVPSAESKTDLYKMLLLQSEALLLDERNTIARLATFSSLIHFAFEHHWTGFYLVEEDELVVGPFQGPPACLRIAYNKGVCGKAWATNKTIIVKDVHQFEGHIACSPLSNSEIVLPIRNSSGEVMGVFDIDSDQIGKFDESDQLYLEKMLANLWV